MVFYVVRRIALLVPTTFGVITLVFFLFHLIPGDPVELTLGQYAPAEKAVYLRKELGLDKPLHAQYFTYLLNISNGNLGKSIRTQREVSIMIKEAIVPTLQLSVTALFIAIMIAIPAGAASTLWKGKFVDAVCRISTVFFLSFPSFFLGPLLIFFISVHLNLLPVSGNTEFGSLILPAITLALPIGGVLSRIVRASFSEEIDKDYIKTAWAKGLTFRRAALFHGMKVSLIPVATIVSLQLGALMTGTIITEKVFRWPGIGSLMLSAIDSRDYPVVQGTILLFAIVYVFANLIADLSYGFLDPRIRYA